MADPCDLIALLTDFGYQDPYVGVMKGVIKKIYANAQIVDLTHDVPPQDVRTAAFHLLSAVPFFPEGTIYIAVVDPGVGTERAGLVLETENDFFVAPDNGLLAPIHRRYGGEIYRLEEKEYWLPEVSATFHGRDVFAPVAAHLADLEDPEDMGPEIEDIEDLELPEARVLGRKAEGEVQHVDRFGNLISNLPNGLAQRVRSVTIGEEKIRRISAAYAVAEPGETVVVPGSAGWLEIAVRNGSAAAKLGAERGTKVEAELA